MKVHAAEPNQKELAVLPKCKNGVTEFMLQKLWNTDDIKAFNGLIRRGLVEWDGKEYKLSERGREYVSFADNSR